MAEKELRTKLDELVGELQEITGEIRGRLAFLNMKKYVKPLAGALIGFVVLKTAFRILSLPIAIIWHHKILIGVAVGFFGYVHMRRSGSEVSGSI